MTGSVGGGLSCATLLIWHYNVISPVTCLLEDFWILLSRPDCTTKLQREPGYKVLEWILYGNVLLGKVKLKGDLTAD